MDQPSSSDSANIVTTVFSTMLAFVRSVAVPQSKLNTCMPVPVPSVLRFVTIHPGKKNHHELQCLWAIAAPKHPKTIKEDHES